MKATLPLTAISLVLALLGQAEICHEVVRDASGRIVQTVESRKQAGGAVQSVTRDASGRLTGNSTTGGNTGGSFAGTNRDASGRLTGSNSGSKKCLGTASVPVPPPGTKK